MSPLADARFPGTHPGPEKDDSPWQVSWLAGRRLLTGLPGAQDSSGKIMRGLAAYSCGGSREVAPFLSGPARIAFPFNPCYMQGHHWRRECSRWRFPRKGRRADATMSHRQDVRSDLPDASGSGEMPDGGWGYSSMRLPGRRTLATSVLRRALRCEEGGRWAARATRRAR
jgi:hypothetical protein